MYFMPIKHFDFEFEKQSRKERETEGDREVERERGGKRGREIPSLVSLLNSSTEFKEKECRYQRISISNYFRLSRFTGKEQNGRTITVQFSFKLPPPATSK